jgi:hypothetical protein
VTDRYIPLTQGQWAVIDDEDFEEIAKYKWCAHLHTGKYYAERKVSISNKKIAISMHRQLLGILDNPTLEGDHINGDTLDNRRSNLRPATHKQNQENRLGAQVNSVTGVRGVHPTGTAGAYKAELKHNGKTVYLGCFPTVEEAAKAVDAGRAKYFTPVHPA